MVLRRTGLDDLPLIVVLGLSTTLLVWAGVGGESAVRAGGNGDGNTSRGTRAWSEHLAAAPSQASAWRALAGELAAQATPGTRDEVAAGPGAFGQPEVSDAAVDTGLPNAPRFVQLCDEFGRPIAEGSVLDGRPQGRWTVWRADGTRVFTGRFEGGEPEGNWDWWHENGELRAEGIFLAGAAEGPWREWYADGTLASALMFQSGALQGEAHEWFENGQQRSSGHYNSGEREGAWSSWYDNGQPRATGAYRQGLREGPWREWHDNGAPMLDATYRRGRPEGLWREWYRNGQLKAQGHFDDGRRQGAWVFFEYDGTPDARTGDYELGRRVRS